MTSLKLLRSAHSAHCALTPEFIPLDLSPVHTVAENGDCRRKCDSRRFRRQIVAEIGDYRQCGQAFMVSELTGLRSCWLFFLEYQATWSKRRCTRHT